MVAHDGRLPWLSHHGRGRRREILGGPLREVLRETLREFFREILHETFRVPCLLEKCRLAGQFLSIKRVLELAWGILL